MPLPNRSTAFQRYCKYVELYEVKINETTNDTDKIWAIQEFAWNAMPHDVKQAVVQAGEFGFNHWQTWNSMPNNALHTHWRYT